ncbi:MAG: right-handed parallel beta-helix repeat-containing protein [Myxococcales bacterium]|nr:right-handed parallel beta-helix repeat-containing protein [Myxococcales bacterium]
MEAAETAGVWARGTGLTASDIRVDRTRAGPEALGYGMLASDGAQLTVRGGAITASAAVGIVVVGGGADLDSVAVRGNVGGGIRLEGARVEARGLVLDGNTGFGLGLVRSTGTIQGVTVRDTLEALGGGGGDGLVVTGGAEPGAPDLQIGGCLLTGNHRLGSLMDGVGGVRLTDTDFTRNGGGGLWIQGRATDETVIENSRFTENDLVGVAVVQAGPLTIQGNRIEGTIGADLADARGVGDGISVYDTAVDVVDNRVADNARLGLILGAARGRLTDNEIDQDVTAVVLQGGSDQALVVTGTTFTGLAMEIEVRGPGDDLPIARERLEGRP